VRYVRGVGDTREVQKEDSTQREGEYPALVRLDIREESSQFAAALRLPLVLVHRSCALLLEA
jgi:hypothetical protein